MKKLLINAANLHVGGGVQVATSFLYELHKLLIDEYYSDFEISVLVSTEVDINLMELKCDVSCYKNYTIRDANGFFSYLSGVYSEITKYDLVFTIFGPLYSIRRPKFHVCGFAQPRLIYNYFDGKKRFFLEHVLNKLKNSFQLNLYKYVDIIIVELAHVKNGLREKGIYSKEIIVINNCINGVFQKKDIWSEKNFCFPRNKFTIGIVSRDYEHKNIGALPFVKKILEDKYDLNVNFVVTFSDSEWSRKDNFFKNNIINVGAISVIECPAFYDQIDAVIFPSLLECFSATPLEALIMRKAIFASERNFVRDICGVYAYYFDPLDYEDISSVIANYINNTYKKDKDILEDAYMHALALPGADQRAKDYMRTISDYLCDEFDG